MKKLLIFLLTSLPLLLCCQEKSSSLHDRVSHHYAENDGVKIHYVSIGEGPVVVMLHGFPDYWYTWREQMEVLKENFNVVAVDLRGYNLSGQPKEVDAYKMQYLVEDVVAVIKSLGKDKAIVVGHDWGGAIAWQVAIRHPEMVEKLIVCNMTHPTGYSRASLQALQENGNTSYMDEFRKHTAETLPISWLSGWVKDKEAKKHYEIAFKRSYVDGMVHFYRANSSTKEQRAEWLKNPVIQEIPKIQMPVLAIFGTKDQYVSKEGLNNTWDWMEKDFTLVTIPSADHFVQQDAPELVSNSMKMWLLRDQKEIAQRPLADLNWILGTWKRTKGNNTIYEEWKQISPNVFEGKSYLITGENEKKHLEDLLIAAMGGEVFYIPKVAQNELPISFKLMSQDSNGFIFENIKHDFPQRIKYSSTGERELSVVISDEANSKKIPFVFERK